MNAPIRDVKSISCPFALPVTPGGFKVITADPPWHFKSNSRAAPGRNAMRHYDCMSLADIAALPVADIAAPDAVLLMWITGPFLAIGAHIPIMKAWGFKPNSMGFTWAKTTSTGAWHFGGGFTTRKNEEFVVMGKRGRSVRAHADVRSLLVAPVREHSRKPDIFFESVERYSGGPYCELFARQTRPGWSNWGRESNKFDLSLSEAIPL